jgi:hypothetical protein
MPRCGHVAALWPGSAARYRAAGTRPRVLGPDDPHTLAARQGLAGLTGQVGDPAAARDLLAAVLPDLERVLGPDDRHTLAGRL